MNFLNGFENNPGFGVNFKSAQRATTAAAAGTPGSTAPSTTAAAQAADKAPYTFSATVGLIGQATSAAVTTGVPGAPASTQGGSNVR